MSSVPATRATRTPAEAAASAIDVAHERAATAGSSLSSHFNAAGSALPSRTVVDVVVDHLRREESKGGYEAAGDMRPSVERIYASAAELVGAEAREIALFDSASTGLRVILDALRPGSGQRIVASSSTYVSHALHLMSLADERGVALEIAPTTPGRTVDLAALEEILSDGIPSIVTVAHIPTSSGLVEPVAAIGELVRRHGGTYIVDATQSVGHLDLDVEAIACDALVATGRKFLRGPRGTGFAYVRGALLDALPPAAPDVRGAQWTGHDTWVLDDSARRFETWEGAIAARLGLGRAIDEALERGMGATEQWLVDAGRRLREGLAAIPGVTVLDPAGSESAIVTFSIEGIEPAQVVPRLAEANVRLVAVPATHGQWDLGDRGIPSVVRASPHVYNDDADLERLLAAVTAVAGASA